MLFQGFQRIWNHAAKNAELEADCVTAVDPSSFNRLPSAIGISFPKKKRCVGNSAIYCYVLADFFFSQDRAGKYVSSIVCTTHSKRR